MSYSLLVSRGGWVRIYEERMEIKIEKNIIFENK